MSNLSRRRSKKRHWHVEEGDVLETLADLEDGSFHGVLTDPPYALGFMGKSWDRQLPSVEVWREMLRVCKPGAMLLAFGSPRTSHRLACQIEDAGWELRDCIHWLYGEGMPKALNLGKAIDKRRKVVGTKPNPHRGVAADNRHGFSSPNRDIPATPEAVLWDGYATTLKPAYEPILLAMKPLDGTFAENALAHGCGGLNINGCRIGTGGRTTRSHQSPYPRKANGTEDRTKCWARSGHTVEAINGGRWPTNVILDEEVAGILDRQNPTSKSRRSVRRTQGSTLGNGKTLHPFKSAHACIHGYEDEGGPSRFFYCAKASRQERAGNPHPTLKPLRLCEYLARLILPPARCPRLLVPYSGSGSEMVAALQAGWSHVVGIEREADYVAVAKKRLLSPDAA